MSSSARHQGGAHLPTEKPTHEPLLERLNEHLLNERYCSKVTREYPAAASRFLSFLREKDLGIETSRPAHVQEFLEQELQSHLRRYGRRPRDSWAWQRMPSAAVHMLLRLGLGQWPPPQDHTNAAESFRQRLCDEYAQWLSACRALAPATIQARSANALDLLQSLEDRGTESGLALLTTGDIDAYIKLKAPGLRRTTRAGMATHLRSFLRFLHDQKRIGTDLAGAVLGPPRYLFEDIPSVLRPDDAVNVLKTCRKDQTPTGLRDYAILMLLTSYGLRAGEVAGLRLEDIDWRNDRLHVRHSKTGSEVALPLLAPVGEAILRYIQKARPASKDREIFIRMHAPYRAMRRGGSLYRLVDRRLQQAGVRPVGRHGPHIFRHGLAVNLLRAGVSMKSIGDILGHKSVDSTAVYLKLATEDLRAVALNLPREVSR
jgi:integrase/recombinase XerD